MPVVHLELDLWNLTPPLAIWGLFSDKLEYQEKVDIAAKLLTFTPPKDDNLNKPEFPSVTQETKLIDLITQKTVIDFSRSWVSTTTG